MAILVLKSGGSYYPFVANEKQKNIYSRTVAKIHKQFDECGYKVTKPSPFGGFKLLYNDYSYEIDVLLEENTDRPVNFVRVHAWSEIQYIEFEGIDELFYKLSIE